MSPARLHIRAVRPWHDGGKNNQRFFGNFSRLIFLVAIFGMPAYADVAVTKGANLNVDVHREDGRIAMDLLGGIWIVPAKGGDAVLATDGMQQASRPRWSPDGRQILYQVTSAEGTALWLLDVQSSASNRISEPAANDLLASWHPDGERIVYSSGRNEADFDLWETDLPTGLSWRLSDDTGDELEAVWSAHGDHLAYIRKMADEFSIVVRRRGRSAMEIFTSDEPLSGLSWRPDGTLLTYSRGQGDNLVSEMVILSDPPLIREFAKDERLFPSAVSWLDRSRHVYAADGTIRRRAFGDWRSRQVRFRAVMKEPEARPHRTITARNLTIVDAPDERLVIRGARLFDGIWATYRQNMDVLIADGKIIAIEPSREWQDATILDLGNVTIMPGLIDTWATLPTTNSKSAGLIYLSYGVTTIVANQADDDFDPQIWAGAEHPGPRVLAALEVDKDTTFDNAGEFFLASISSVLSAQDIQAEQLKDLLQTTVPIVAGNWATYNSIDADVLLGIESLPRSAIDDRYQQEIGASARLANIGQAITVISGIADASTPGLEALLQSRQAKRFGQSASPDRRHSELPVMTASSASILLGSRPNGMPPGMALHAELRALGAAGLTGEQVLHTAGKNPARTLGLENQIGTITPGAMADLVLVNGDPLGNVDDVLNIVAVIRNGRFFSLVRLLEQADQMSAVE